MVNRKQIRTPLYILLPLLSLSLGSISLAGARGSPDNPESETGNPGIFFPLIVDNYLNGPGEITGTVIDARNGNPISGVEVCLEDSPLCVLTDLSGQYKLSDIPSGFRPFTASAENYSSLTKFHLVKAGQTTELNFSLSSNLEVGQYRIVVTWDDNPPDLDAHLWTSDVDLPHVYQGNRGSCPPDPVTTACLDKDDQNGFGPETITIFESNVLGDVDMFQYGILNFSRPFGFEPLTTSNAEVQLYDHTGLIARFTAPTSGDPDLDMWYVFDLHGPSSTLILVNCLTTEPTNPDEPPTCPP